MVFGDLLSNPAVQAWAISSIVVALKTMAAGMYTSTIRIRKSVFASNEDYAMQSAEPAAGLDDEVERSRRIHQNDLETGLPFMMVGLVYALTGPSTTGLWLCFAGFPLARIAHSIVYARRLMPHRTIAFMVGWIITLWMALSSLWALLIS